MTDNDILARLSDLGDHLDNRRQLRSAPADIEPDRHSTDRLDQRNRRRRPPKRLLSVAAALVLVGVAVAGLVAIVSRANTPSNQALVTSDPRPALIPSYRGTDLDLTLPIVGRAWFDRMDFSLSAQTKARLYNLWQASIAECMHGRGFADYQPIEYPVNDAYLDQVNPLDRAYAEVMGYHPLPATPIDLNVQLEATSLAAGSCSNLVSPAIYRQLGNYSTADQQLHGQLERAYIGFETSETGNALGAAWSACMARSGYDFARPNVAFFAFSEELTITTDEIATRLTDLDCDIAVGYTQSRHDWEAARVDTWRAGAHDAIQAAIADRAELERRLEQMETTAGFSTTTTTASRPPGAAPDSTAYCDEVALLDGDHPEAYIGSAEHQADVANLIDLAPESLLGPLKTFSEFLGSGAITTENSDSNLVDNWPPAVQQAISEITAYNTASC